MSDDLQTRSIKSEDRRLFRTLVCVAARKRKDLTGDRYAILATAKNLYNLVKEVEKEMGIELHEEEWEEEN